VGETNTRGKNVRANPLVEHRELTLDTLFWISAGFVVYTYAIYPLIIIIWGGLFPRRADKRYAAVPLSVVVAAKNEEINIKTRIENLLAQDYPDDSVEIIVVSDGSTDRTVELARGFVEQGVKVIELPEPVGKSGALNAGVAAATNDIVVFADARQRFGENVFAELTSRFADERVGAVSGELIIERGVSSEVHEGVGIYWRYEKLIRRMESRANSVVGATGSIYAIRRRLFTRLEEHTLLDDFLVPMRIVLQGFRVLFMRSARAYDIVSTTSSREFERKVRTLAGNFQAVAMEPQLLNPLRNRVFFQFVSHKLARLVVPYFCVIALVASAFSATPVLRVVFLLQLVFYAAGLLTLTRVGKAGAGALFRVSWTFIVLNAAAVAGLWVFLTRRSHTVWK
jgi:cellulose synthase/poly-beta-1,6-N-acetylglucosamine synthase-like glycosyltransferase